MDDSNVGMALAGASPKRSVHVQLIYVDEMRFGPPYFALELNGRVLRRWGFRRYFGNACAWSSDRRFLAVSEWRSLSEARGPDTELRILDIQERREALVARSKGGFVEPIRFEGSVLFFVASAFNEKRQETAQAGQVDASALHGWRRLGVLLR